MPIGSATKTKSLESASLQVKTAWQYQNLGAFGGSSAAGAVDGNQLNNSVAITDGNGTDPAAPEADYVWWDQRTVSAATPNDDLDLSGVLADRFGDVLTPTKLAAVHIFNRSTTSGDRLKVGAAAANPIVDMFGAEAASLVGIGPSSPMVIADFGAGFTIAAGSADTLRVTYDGSSGSITYDIVLIFKA